MIQDELFFAWLDGELDEEAAGRVAAAVAASPDLAARAEQHRQLAAGLRGAFESVVEGSGAAPRFEPSEVIDLGAMAAERDRRRSWLAAPQLAAMAASLAVGLLIGTQFIGPAVSPVAVEGGHLVATASLGKALDTSLASTPADEGPRVGLTFRDASGRYCRSFSDASASGLACRQGGRWQVEGLFPAAEGRGGDYRMAGGEGPRLAALIDETISGEPFDAGQEKAARDGGWR